MEQNLDNRITVRLPPALLERLEIEAATRFMKVSQLIRNVLTDFVKEKVEKA